MRDRRGWMSGPYSKLDAWSRIRPRIKFQDVQAAKRYARWLNS